MRFRKLELLRYGHFTDRDLLFPLHDGGYDFHLIHGNNEDGKSTTRQSIDDLLFGIPKLTPYAFLHGYDALRIGAILEHQDQITQFYRKKGNKDTLRNHLDEAVSEENIRFFLGGCTKEFYQRMFSLDQERLAAGGKDILEAKDEIGQILFAAGSGIAHLHQKLSWMEKEAEGFWAPKKAKGRLYYEAKERVESADKRLKEVSVTANQWQRIQEVYQAAQKASGTEQTDFQKRFGQLLKYKRIQSIFPDIHRKKYLDYEVENLGPVIRLPEEARETLDEISRIESETLAQQRILRHNLEEAEGRLSGLIPDETILRHAGEIQDCLKESGRYEQSRKELPQSRQALESTGRHILQCARDLGWEAKPVEVILDRLPVLSKIKAIQTHLENQGALESRVASCREASQKALFKHEELEQKRAGMESARDISGLEQELTALDESFGLMSDFKTQMKESRRLAEQLDLAVKRLSPQCEVGNLSELSIPTIKMVADYQEQFKKIQTQLEENQTELKKICRELERKQNERTRLIQQKNPVTGEQVHESRKHRQTGWNFIYRRYIQLEAPDEIQPDEIQKEALQQFTQGYPDLTAAYTAAVETSDQLADRRLDSVTHAAKLEQLDDDIADLQLRQNQHEQVQTELENRFGQLQEDWHACWVSIGIEPETPDDMAEWLTQREAILTLQKEYEHSEQEKQRLQEQIDRFKTRLLALMDAMGVSASELRDRDLDYVRILARTYCDQERRRADEISSLEKQIQETYQACQEAERAHLQAEQNISQWEEQGSILLRNAGLEPSLTHVEVRLQLETFQVLRDLEKERQTLIEDRIRKTEAHMTLFETQANALLGQVAPDLHDMEITQAVLHLSERLKEAQQIAVRRKDEEKQIRDYQKQISESHATRDQAMIRLAPLRRLAGLEELQKSEETEGIALLKTAIERSDRLRQLEAERDAILTRLSGHGKAVSELEAECAEIDADQLPGLIQCLEEEVQKSQHRIHDLATRLKEAQDNYESVTGDNASIDALTQKQMGLVEMGDAAEQYIALKSQAILLRWGIDRYRRENQAPLLRRAGALFSRITLGSFEGLEVDYTEEDRARLLGVRPDGKRVPVDGMSGGAEDQLYLALRIAAIEEYLEKAHKLPFITDDIFIKFDQHRISAGLNILLELSRQTQVIFFTHEREIVEIAGRELGDKVNLVQLPSQAVFRQMALRDL